MVVAKRDSPEFHRTERVSGIWQFDCSKNGASQTTRRFEFGSASSLPTGAKLPSFVVEISVSAFAKVTALLPNTEPSADQRRAARHAPSGMARFLNPESERFVTASKPHASNANCYQNGLNVKLLGLAKVCRVGGR
jgi:hypothetical protein